MAKTKSRPLHFLVAPDKFKGSLAAGITADVIEKGIRRILPRAKVTKIPIADGGDGTADILSHVLKANIIDAEVEDPLGGRTVAKWGLKNDAAYLDLATASGLALLRPKLRNPLKTSTFGLGQLMSAAVREGARELTLGLGGSATVDAGLGAMMALGIRFLDEKGKPVSRGGASLERVEAIDTSNFVWKDHPHKIRIVLLTDVRNPLLGPEGAAPVFGPQKGASPDVVKVLESGLARVANVIRKDLKRSVDRIPGGGAAGGVSAGFLGVLGSLPNVEVTLKPGAEYILDLLGIPRKIEDTDWVFTAEGKLDSQTMHGKAVGAVAALARKKRKPAIAFAGLLDLHQEDLARLGLVSAFSIAPGPASLEESLDQAAPWLEETVARVTRLIAASSPA
jgi:glycerate 2-kinase